MPVLSKRGLRKLHKVLEDWISEDWDDSSDSDDFFSPPIRSRRAMRTMESKRSDVASSPASEHPGTSSEDERMSSRMSMSSASTDHLPPPPQYESVIKHPAKDFSTGGNKESRWEREINDLVGDFDRRSSFRDQGYSTLPNSRRVSSGAQSSVHEESSSSSRRSVSPPRSSSVFGIDRDFDWDRSLLSRDDVFRDSHLRNRRPFGGHPFGGMRSAFGEDIDRFFGRGTFSTEWDTFFPEITHSDFGRGSSLSSTRSQTRTREVPVVSRNEDFKVEVDVQGFEPHELLVKTAGHSLLVMAKSGVSNGEDQGSNRKVEFRELKREFTIPSNVNPTDITSNLTPEGVLVIEAPSSEKLSIMSREGGDEKGAESIE